MLQPQVSVQSPRAFADNNLTGVALAARATPLEWASRLADANTAAVRSQLRAAMQDQAYLYAVHPNETDFGLTDSDLVFGWPVGHVNRYGALEDGVTAADDAFTIAFDLLREYGGYFGAGKGPYVWDEEHEMLLDELGQRDLARLIEWQGTVIDCSSYTGSMVALKVGGESINFLAETTPQIMTGGVLFIGPEPHDLGSSIADFEWMNDPTYTNTAIQMQYAKHWIVNGICSRFFYRTLYRTWTWDDVWINCDLGRAYIGETIGEACTHSTHIQCRYEYCAFDVVAYPGAEPQTGISAQRYLSCGFERSHVGYVQDPGHSGLGGSDNDVTIIGVTFDNHYIEGMDGDLCRINKTFSDMEADWTVRGDDSNKYSLNFEMHTGEFSHTFSSTKKMIVFPDTIDDRVYGIRCSVPASFVSDCVNPGSAGEIDWHQKHSAQNLGSQVVDHYKSNEGFCVIDANGTPPTLITSWGNILELTDWPSALGGGGTLATGKYLLTFRHNYYSSTFNYVVNAQHSGAGGRVRRDYVNSGRSDVMLECLNAADAGVNPTRLEVRISGREGNA